MDGDGGSGGAAHVVIEPQTCNDRGTIEHYVVSPVPAGIQSTGLDGFANEVIVSGRRGDGTVVLQRLAGDLDVTVELLGQTAGGAPTSGPRPWP